MVKALVIDYTTCHGCRTCETACSMVSELNIGTSQPRVTCITWELDGWGVRISCQQCQDAPCMAVCPKNAIYRDEELNRVMVNYNRCIGCRMCVAMCPFGAMDFDGETKKVIKCDLCDGDPLCAKLCSYEAIQYVDAREMCTTKTTEVAEKLREILLSGKVGIHADFVV